jgi:hypothetical protein
VPPTSLAQKGGDDRNISLYFVFVPESMAQRFGIPISAAFWE